MDPKDIATAIVTVIVAMTGAAITLIPIISKAKADLMRVAKEAADKAEVAVDKAEAASTKSAANVEKIHQLVNDAASKAAAKIAALEKLIADLQEQRVKDAKESVAHVSDPLRGEKKVELVENTTKGKDPKTLSISIKETK